MEEEKVNYHILTLFPEMVMDGLNTSIIGRATKKGILSIEAINIRDYTKEKHGHVDDAPYGGGAGMVMQPAPVCDAYEALCEKIGKRPRVLYMTPQGRVFNQKIAEELSKEEDLVFLCGHYEGIDERALEMIVTDYLSIGDYVLTGGELPAMVVIDSVSRLVPGSPNIAICIPFFFFCIMPFIGRLGGSKGIFLLTPDQLNNLQEIMKVNHIYQIGGFVTNQLALILMIYGVVNLVLIPVIYSVYKRKS